MELGGGNLRTDGWVQPSGVAKYGPTGAHLWSRLLRQGEGVSSDDNRTGQILVRDVVVLDETHVAISGEEQGVVDLGDGWRFDVPVFGQSAFVLVMTQ